MYKSLNSQLYSGDKLKPNVYLKDGKVYQPKDVWFGGKPALLFGKTEIVVLSGIKSLLMTNQGGKGAERIDNFVPDINYGSDPEPIDTQPEQKIDLPLDNEANPFISARLEETPNTIIQPMSYKQKRYLFVLTGKNYGRNDFNKVQASEKISELLTVK